MLRLTGTIAVLLAVVRADRARIQLNLSRRQRAGGRGLRVERGDLGERLVEGIRRIAERQSARAIGRAAIGLALGAVIHDEVRSRGPVTSMAFSSSTAPLLSVAMKLVAP